MNSARCSTGWGGTGSTQQSSGGIPAAMKASAPSMMDLVVSRYTARSPLSLMARIGLERCFSDATLDKLFERHRVEGYTRELAFSSAVDLMTLVVTGNQPSVRAAYQQRSVGVALKCVYEKLQHLETSVCEAMVEHTATKADELLAAMNARRPPWLPGYRVKILDGNHLAATDRRLKALRASHAGPLPGFVLAVFEPDTELLRRVRLCEDGHAQERSLLQDVLPMVQQNDCWIGDRNFCTTDFLLGIAARKGTFLIRQHGSLSLPAAGERRACGRAPTGEVFEQEVLLQSGGRSLRLRRITLVLDQPSRDGDREIHLLSNLPATAATAVALAEQYRVRWRIENAFNRLALWLDAELAPLGYPRAALFGFCVGILAYNLMVTLLGALRAAHGADKVDSEVSGYLLVQDVRMNAPGLDVMIDAEEWTLQYKRRTVAEVASEMLTLAAKVDLKRLPKAKTRPKNATKPRTENRDKPHASTARLLAGTPRTKA